MIFYISVFISEYEYEDEDGYSIGMPFENIHIECIQLEISGLKQMMNRFDGLHQ